jgi:hypothetical protein
MHLFGLDAERPTLQALVDTFLTPVTSPGLAYDALVGHALLTLVDIEKGTSSAEAVGWLPGRECALWIPLIETRLFPIPALRLVMWSPYIFISYAIGMATGREVWGWSKALADIAFPAPASASPQFTVDTVVFRELDATKPGEDATLLTVTGDGPLSTASPWKTLQEAAEEVIAKFVPVLPLGVVNPFLAAPDFPAIALKQFRDSSVPSLACYQAIVNSPVRIKNFGGGGFHSAGFEVAIETCASHPIADKFFGVPPEDPSTPVSVDWAAWVKFDFDAIPGSVISSTT